MSEAVLVTGAAGFLGRHVVRELRSSGRTVVGVDRAEGDLRVPGVIDLLLDKHRPGLVVHLAARVGRLFGEDAPLDTIADNVGMTALVARACGERGIRLAYASTSEVYGDNGDSVCDELDGPFALPHNLYGLTKGFGEDVCSLYAPEGLVVLRFSMPFGPGLPWGRGRAAIINMLWQAREGMEIPVHRGAERSWCWVGDTATAVRVILESGEGPFNVGRDDQPVSMLEVARYAVALAGGSEDQIVLVDPPANQTVVKRLRTDRLRALGWEPLVDWREGMRLTYEALAADWRVGGEAEIRVSGR